MKYHYYLKRIKRYTYKELLKKGIIRFNTIILHKVFFVRDLFCITYSGKCNHFLLIKYCSQLDNKIKYSLYTMSILDMSELYINHYFDLLGSGWVQEKKGMDCLGLEGYRYEFLSVNEHDGNLINRSNLRKSEKIKNLIDKNYTPIDWQLDFKSGYRWSEKTWYMDIKYGHKLGVDIKVPWELARMQHLSMLAWAYGSIADDKEKYAREFRNQILDFIANNPPRFGVNWRCTMDVGIRVANWLMAYDLFRAAGAEFDMDFEQIFSNSVYDHGNHIINNLEYTSQLRSNHYLSNIAGLLFVAAHLESSKEIDRWLAFSVQELISEMEHEFNSDGSNFEASTSYHRLSTEIMLYCAILCLILPEEKKQALINYSVAGHCVKPKLNTVSEQLYDINNRELFPAWFWERLEKACEFTLHITKPNGEIPQIGDNDSGRFLKLWLSYDKMTVKEAISKYNNLEGYADLPESAIYYDENILDHQHILAVGGVLFKRKDFLQAVDCDNLEKNLVENLLAGRAIQSYHLKNGLKQAEAYNRYIISKRSLPQWKSYLQGLYGQPKISIFNDQEKRDITEHLQLSSYPDFGLYIYKSPCFYLAIRCGSVGQHGNGGHAHNDQLSIELYMNEKDVVRDSGTYIYTALPEKRNAFRSTLAHFTPPIQEREQNDWLPGVRGLFQLSWIADYKVLFFDQFGFVGMHSGFGRKVYRIIEISTYSVTVSDYGAGIDYNMKKIYMYSNGYGKLVK